MRKDDLVYIIILNWNGWKNTVECVESCRKLLYSQFRILVVDNGSTDGSANKLKELLCDIELIETDSNLGFAGGNNVGIRYALDKKADYVWLLNNDTAVDPRALDELMSVARSDNRIGILGSKIYYYDKPDTIWFAGGYIDYRRGDTGHIGGDTIDDGTHDVMIEVDYITGCSIMIRKQAIEDAGLMDERFYLFFEEVDWNLRIKNLGYKIFFAPSSIVWHKVSQSIGYCSPAYHFYLFRNSLLFIQKHRLHLLPVVMMYKVKDIFLLYRSSGKQAAKSAVQGLIAFGLRNFGALRPDAHADKPRSTIRGFY